jgi:hypothetical protein
MMCYAKPMRTTLDLDEDVLGVAKELAAQKRVSTGKIVSDLMRQALAPKKAPRMRNGVPLLEPRPGARPITLELVNELRDEE